MKGKEWFPFCAISQVLGEDEFVKCLHSVGVEMLPKFTFYWKYLGCTELTSQVPLLPGVPDTAWPCNPEKVSIFLIQLKIQIHLLPTTSSRCWLPTARTNSRSSALVPGTAATPYFAKTKIQIFKRSKQVSRIGQSCAYIGTAATPYLAKSAWH